VLQDTTLLITANRRPDYLRRTLDSWAQVPEIGRLRGVDVALGWSPRWDDQLEVIRQAERPLGWSIGVIRDSQAAHNSPGMHRALGEAINRKFGDPRVEYVICGEEDVIVSSDVLAYTAFAQRWYDEHVLCICAHNRGGCGWDGLDGPREDDAADQEKVRLLPYFNPWVWCIGRSQWRNVARPVWDWDCDGGGGQDSGYDWGMQRLSALGPWRNLVPDAARSQTIGELAGWASTPEIFPLQQSLSFRERRNRPVYRLQLGDPGWATDDETARPTDASQ
jgi:hypothetical protein